MQTKFDDFQADLKANEVRLAEMNEIAMQLVSLWQTQAAMQTLRIWTRNRASYKKLQMREEKPLKKLMNFLRSIGMLMKQKIGLEKMMRHLTMMTLEKI